MSHGVPELIANSFDRVPGKPLVILLTSRLIMSVDSSWSAGFILNLRDLATYGGNHGTIAADRAAIFEFLVTGLLEILNTYEPHEQSRLENVSPGDMSMSRHLTEYVWPRTPGQTID